MFVFGGLVDKTAFQDKDKLETSFCLCAYIVGHNLNAICNKTGDLITEKLIAIG